jgi:acetyl-CoA carboxylase carboxyl transferase subunit alpha
MNRQIHDLQMADYIELIFDTFMELRGDRRSGDDKTVIGGLARLDGHKTVVIGYQSDKSAKIPKAPGPDGYRKCMRLISLAEAFSKPVIIFVDIPAASSLPASEQQKADEALARNLGEMSCLMTPIIGVLIGKSSAITAIDMCAADCVLILEGTSFPVSLLRGTSASGAEGKTGEPASREVREVDILPLNLKGQDLLNLGVAHRLVKEPPSGAPESAANALREVLSEEICRLTEVNTEVLVQQRLCRLRHQSLNLGTELLSGNLPRIAECEKLAK